MATDTNLTEKQRLFCEEYIVRLDGTEAAIKAGYSERTAPVIASENLRKPKIAAYLRELTKARCERTQVDADWVLKNAAKGFEINAKTITDDNGVVKMVNPNAAAKFLELTGKHVAVKAWDKPEEKNAGTDIANALTAIIDKLPS